MLNYGSPELQAKVVPEVLDGKKFICLAISEAFAGSDVGGLQTYAERDGDEWVITGTKKWITNGTFADYFTVAARTDVRSFLFIASAESMLMTAFPRAERVRRGPRPAPGRGRGQGD